MNSKEAMKIWKDHIENLKTSKTILDFSEKNKKSEKLREAMNYISKNHLCMTCGKKMHMCKDSKTGKLSNYIWRCKCMPKGMQIMVC